MHVHTGFKDALNFLVMYLIVRFFIMQVTTRWPDSAIGKALAVLG